MTKSTHMEWLEWSLEGLDCSCQGWRSLFDCSCSPLPPLGKQREKESKICSGVKKLQILAIFAPMRIKLQCYSYIAIKVWIIIYSYIIMHTYIIKLYLQYSMHDCFLYESFFRLGTLVKSCFNKSYSIGHFETMGLSCLENWAKFNFKCTFSTNFCS